MNKLCCVLSPRVVCKACNYILCDSCIYGNAGHLQSTGRGGITRCATTGKLLTYIIVSDELTVWKIKDD